MSNEGRRFNLEVLPDLTIRKPDSTLAPTKTVCPGSNGQIWDTGKRLSRNPNQAREIKQLDLLRLAKNRESSIR